jgi:hypothetical protein
MKRIETLPSMLGRQLLYVLAQFLQRSGVQNDDIKSALQGLIDQHLSVNAPKLSGAKKIYSRQPIDFAGDIFRAWHRNALFLTADASPKPLSLYGTRNSIAAIARTIDPAADVKAAVSMLKASKGLRSCSNGTYLPSNQYYAHDPSAPESLGYMANCVVQLVSTLMGNASRVKQNETLLQQCASISDLDPDELKVFNQFTHTQGLAFLYSIDDWLEKRHIGYTSPGKKKKRTRKGISAGVHVFAYIGEPEKPKPKRKSAPKKKVGAATPSTRASKSSRRSTSVVPS